MTPSEEIINRYKPSDAEADAFGRLIRVRRLRMSEHVKLDEMGEGLASRGPAVLAAMVCEIDGTHITFPKNRGELNAILDSLDIEGIEAANKALRKLTGIVEDGEPGSEIEAAKK